METPGAYCVYESHLASLVVSMVVVIVVTILAFAL
jgi:hypothetical protein